MHLKFIALVAMLSAAEAKADILAVIVDPGSLSYDMSPENYANSPQNYANAATNFDNSATNFENSPTNYDNSETNYENRMGGGRNIITEEGEALGYYVFGRGGIINFYNYAGVRVAFLPGGGQTQSVFLEDDWCGTIGKINGEMALGMTKACFYAFFIEE